jgi:hypothetical protein
MVQATIEACEAIMEQMARASVAPGLVLTGWYARVWAEDSKQRKSDKSVQKECLPILSSGDSEHIAWRSRAGHNIDDAWECAQMRLHNSDPHMSGTWYCTEC